MAEADLEEGVADTAVAAMVVAVAVNATNKKVPPESLRRRPVTEETHGGTMLTLQENASAGNRASRNGRGVGVRRCGPGREPPPGFMAGAFAYSKAKAFIRWVGESAHRWEKES